MSLYAAFLSNSLSPNNVLCLLACAEIWDGVGATNPLTKAEVRVGTGPVGYASIE